MYQASYAEHDVDPQVPAKAPLHEVLRETLLGGIASVWGIEVMREWLVMSPTGLDKWHEELLKLPLARQVKPLRLAGFTHIVVHSNNDALELFPVIGQGLEEPTRFKEEWAAMVIFPITKPLPNCRWTPLGRPEHDGAHIDPDEDAAGVWQYSGSVVKGLIVCIRPWDPAWHAEINGTKVETQIVNKFQLAIPVPGEAHEIRMEYRPIRLRAARYVRTLSVAALLVLVGLSLLRARKERAAANTGEGSPNILTREEQDPYRATEEGSDNDYG